MERPEIRLSTSYQLVLYKWITLHCCVQVCLYLLRNKNLAKEIHLVCSDAAFTMFWF